MTGSVSGVRYAVAVDLRRRPRRLGAAARHCTRPWRNGGRLLLGGDVAAGIAAAALLAVGHLWLAPVVGLIAVIHHALHHARIYLDRVRAKRRGWATLAEITSDLNQRDEGAVALVGLRGAALLFAPDEVEIIVSHPGGTRVYSARAHDLGRASPAGRVAAEPVWVSRALRVGGTDVGELRLRCERRMSPVDQYALSSFAAANASALHDAATQRRLQALAARSAYDAVHDPLTGLTNRSAFLARAAAELGGLHARSRAALVVLDIDGLRGVNDAFGYATGDQLLATLARRLADQLRPTETLGRLGSDEFAIFMLDDVVTAEPPAGGLVRRPIARSRLVERARVVVADVARPVDAGAATLSVEAHAGLVVELAGCVDMAELLRRAEVALHQARSVGARLVEYDAGSDLFTADRLTLLAELRDALSATDQLTIRLQPTVDLITGAPVGAEALTRWRHPRHGLLAPSRFLGAIEHSDLATAFTRHTVDAALDIASGWASQGIRLPVSVNLCSRCTLHPELVRAISRRLANRAVAPRQLIVEITETVMSEQLDLAERVITDLRAEGVQVCVDDFGTGSASLSFLTTFPVDEVKIARSYVATMLESPQTAAIVRATVDMARDLGLRVVAKGVERAEQRDALLDLGVRHAQGFLFHTPMRVDEATVAMQARAQRATANSIPLVRAL